MKETFIVRTEWSDAIFDLSPEDKATVFDNLFHYHLGNENLINLNNLTVKLVWKLIQPNLIRNIDQYDKRRETSIENGKKGGRPQKESNQDEINLNNLNNNLNNLTEPNETLSVSVSVLDSVIVSDNDLKKNSVSEFSENENPSLSQDEIIIDEPKKEKKEKAPQAGGAVEKKVWGEWVDGQGDGELHELLKDYFLNPNSPRYETIEYKKFKAYWTAKVLTGRHKGKELWRTKETFSISGRLSTWNQNKQNGSTSTGGKYQKVIPLTPTGIEPQNGRRFGKL